MTSLEFAKVISTTAESGKKRGVFIIGGAFGVSAQVKELAQKTICLSDLTMTHLVAELVLLEQFLPGAYNYKPDSVPQSVVNRPAHWLEL